MCDEDAYFREVVYYIHLNYLGAEQGPRFRHAIMRQEAGRIIERIWKKAGIHAKELRMRSRRGEERPDVEDYIRNL